VADKGETAQMFKTKRDEQQYSQLIARNLKALFDVKLACSWMFRLLLGRMKRNSIVTGQVPERKKICRNVSFTENPYQESHLRVEWEVFYQLFIELFMSHREKLEVFHSELKYSRRFALGAALYSGLAVVRGWWGANSVHGGLPAVPEHVTPQAVTATKSGLQWLASRQSADGGLGSRLRMRGMSECVH